MVIKNMHSRTLNNVTFGVKGVEFNFYTSDMKQIKEKKRVYKQDKTLKWQKVIHFVMLINLIFRHKFYTK